MPASGIAAMSVDVRSQFLAGLSPAHRKTILASATQRRFLANTVITNQDHPADHFYLLTKGLARFFFVTEEGIKLLFQWLGPGDLFWVPARLSGQSSYLFRPITLTGCLES